MNRRWRARHASLTLLLVLLAACQAGVPGGVGGNAANPTPTAEPSATLSADPASYGEVVENELCFFSTLRDTARVPWSVVTAGVHEDGSCSGAEHETVVECMGGDIDPSDPAQEAKLTDCLHQTMPDASISSGPSLPGSPGHGVYVDHFNSGPSGASCSAGMGIDPRLAGGAAKETMKTVKTVISFGPVVISFDPMMKARSERADAAASGDAQKYADATAKEAEAVNTYNQTVEAAQKGSEVPTPTSTTGGAVTVLKAVWGWITSKFSSSKTDEQTTEPKPQPEPSGGIGGGEDAGQPVPPGEDGSCENVRQAIEECEALSWSTGPCQIMLAQLTGNCDPMIAYVQEGQPCQSAEYSDEEKKAALTKASIIYCWSKVNPGPEADVCGIRTEEPAMMMVMRGPGGETCGSPLALTTEDQCLPKMTDPGVIAAALVRDIRTVIEVGLMTKDPRPGGGPGPK